MAGPMTTGSSQAQDASTSDLVKQLSAQMSLLARQEVDLAKAELQVKGKQVGVGAGFFGGAGLVGLYALGALIAAVIAALALAMDTWIAALIVAVVLAAIAGVMALTGRSRVQRGTPPLPEQSIESVKEDVQWTKASAQRGRQ